MLHASSYWWTNYEEIWNKSRCFIRSITNNSDNSDQKYMKIKFNSDDDLPLNKTLELHNSVTFVRSVFHVEKNITCKFP